MRPVNSFADLADIVPFNRASHYNLRGKRPEESFDTYLARSGPPNAISTFGCCGCSAGDLQCDGAEGYSDSIVEQGWFFNLADLNQSDAFVASHLTTWIQQMVQNYSIDAIRLDTAPYVPRDFLRRFQDAAGVEIFGEITTSNYTYLASYMKDLPSQQRILAGVFNFKLIFGLQGAFCPEDEEGLPPGPHPLDSTGKQDSFSGSGGASGSGVSGSGFSSSSFSSSGASGSGGQPDCGAGDCMPGGGRLDRLVRILDEHDAAEYAGLLDLDLEMIMIDTHDSERIASKCRGDLVRVSNLLAFLMLMRGIPAVQYGTEFAFRQQTRAPMWPTHFNASAATLYALTARLNQLRHEHRLGRARMRVVLSDRSSIGILRGSEAHGVWLFASAMPAAHVHERRVYCAFGLERAAQASKWVDALSGVTAEFTRSGCYLSPDGLPKVLQRSDFTAAGTAKAQSERSTALHQHALPLEWPQLPLPPLPPAEPPPPTPSAATPPLPVTIHVYLVYTDDGEAYVQPYFEWFVGTKLRSSQVHWLWHRVSPVEFFDKGLVTQAPAGSVVIVQNYHLRDPKDVAFLSSTAPERPRMLRAPRVWSLLNASEPLIILLHSDADCSLELPSSTHHVIYRDTWSASLHQQFVRSRAMEPGSSRRGWPWLRSFPFGTAFDGGNLSKLADAASLRADQRGLLFAFRGTVQWAKPSRQLLVDAEEVHRGRWTVVSDRLMAHAPRIDRWPRRYVIDAKEEVYFQKDDGNWSSRDLYPYASAEVFSYVELMREAVFTLSPPGDLWEAYRTWEAMEAGSIPVVVDNSSYKANGCVRPAMHLIDTAPFVVVVRTWEELPDVLERVASNVSSLVERQAAMARWLAKRKADVRTELIDTSRAMSRLESWRPRTSCRTVPLSPEEVRDQYIFLASFWRRPQVQGGEGALLSYTPQLLSSWSRNLPLQPTAPPAPTQHDPLSAPAL